MKNKILILGGSGFIGQNLIIKLKKLRFGTITSLSRKLPKSQRKISGVEYIACDISNFKKLRKKIIHDYEYIINLSGNIDHKNKVQNLKTHYLGCKNIVNLFLKKKIKLFIQIGSSLEYGNAKSPQKESISCKPDSSYGLAKFKATNFLKKMNYKNKFPFIVLRLYQIYGPFQKLDRLIPYAIFSSLKNKKFKCTDGTQLRDFVYIDDLTDLFIKILKKNEMKYGIFNVGFGKPIKIKNILLLIKKITKKGEPLFGAIKMRKEEIIKLYPYTLKTNIFFKWKPKINIHKGLKKTISFYAK